MKGKERTFSARDSHFSFSPIRVKGIKNSVKCGENDGEWGEKKERKMSLGFSDPSSKEQRARQIILWLRKT